MKEDVFGRSPLQWGFSTLGCPERSLPEAVSLADEFGIRFVEIRALSGSVKLQETLVAPENRAALERLTAAGRVLVVGSSFRLAADQTDVREEMSRQARIADSFGIDYIRVFGGCSIDDPVEKILPVVRDNLQWFQSLGLKKTRIALETHDGLASAARCAGLFDALGEAVPVIWDAHHTWRFANESMKNACSLLKDAMVDVHFKDSVFPAGAEKIRSESPGDGDVPLEELFRLLAEVKFTGPVTLEHEKMWHPYLPELPVALEATAAIVRRTFGL